VEGKFELAIAAIVLAAILDGLERAHCALLAKHSRSAPNSIRSPIS